MKNHHLFQYAYRWKIIVFEVKLENYFYLPSLYHEFKTKAQPLEHLKQNKTQHLKQHRSLLEFDPIVQHTDVTLNTNKTEPFTQFPQNTSHKDLINTIKLSLPAVDDLIPKSPEIYIYFNTEQTEINYTLSYEAPFQQ